MRSFDYNSVCRETGSVDFYYNLICRERERERERGVKFVYICFFRPFHYNSVSTQGEKETQQRAVFLFCLFFPGHLTTILLAERETDRQTDRQTDRESLTHVRQYTEVKLR